MFLPSFLLQVSTKNKALQDTSQAMGMKDKLVQQKAERYHFGYDSLISFPIIIQPSRALGFPPWCWSVCLKASFTHCHQLSYVETYWNPKRTAGKAKSINFQTSHFQAAKLQRVPPEQFGPWSFNGHLHWHHFFPQNPESIKIQDWSRWVCLCLFLNSRFFGHISGFLDMVKNGWNEIEANPVHCSALTEWIWFRWHAAHWWSYDFLRCYLLLISAETPWHRISLK